jgi:hypothetical protein
MPRIDGARLLDDLKTLRSYGAEGNGAVRTALTKVDVAARDWLLGRMKAAGLEAEIDGIGKPHRPYEFGVKVTITTTNKRCKGGQFVLHAKALPGNPYDGHTLGTVIAETQALTGREIERVYVDKGYRGHDAPKPLRVFLSGQKRGVCG